MPPRPHLALPTPGSRRAVVIGAGSFGTAVAVLLARGGFRTTLQTRTPEQCRVLEADRENKAYLAGVELPRYLRIEPASEGVARADYVFLGVPSRGLDEVIRGLEAAGLGRRTPVVSLAKGLVPPAGTAPTVLLSAALGYGARRLRGRARPRARDGHGGRGSRGRLARRAPGGHDRQRLHARGRRVRAVQRPDRRRARGRGQERRGAGGGRDGGRGPQRRGRGGRAHLPGG